MPTAFHFIICVGVKGLGILVICEKQGEITIDMVRDMWNVTASPLLEYNVLSYPVYTESCRQ